jgi:hypothetical protein
MPAGSTELPTSPDTPHKIANPIFTQPLSVYRTAAGGEGFNALRDDMDFVRIHPGVISAQDGLAGSDLSGDHRWDNPVVKLVVTPTS